MDVVEQLRIEVDTITSNIEKNIRRRRRILEKEEAKLLVVENKIISDALSSVAGISKRLAVMRQGKAKSDQGLIMDINSHGSITIGEARRR